MTWLRVTAFDSDSDIDTVRLVRQEHVQEVEQVQGCHTRITTNDRVTETFPVREDIDDVLFMLTHGARADDEFEELSPEEENLRNTLPELVRMAHEELTKMPVNFEQQRYRQRASDLLRQAAAMMKSQWRQE